MRGGRSHLSLSQPASVDGSLACTHAAGLTPPIARCAAPTRGKCLTSHRPRGRHSSERSFNVCVLKIHICHCRPRFLYLYVFLFSQVIFSFIDLYVF